MLYIEWKGHFDSAHRLPGYPGKCAVMHGHTWHVTVLYSVIGEMKLDEFGMMVDFISIKAAVDELDHCTLNDIKDLAIPTAEHIACWIWRHLPPPPTASMVTVTVQEGVGGVASYQDVKYPEKEEEE